MNRIRSFILIALYACLVPNVSGTCTVRPNGNLYVIRKLFSKNVLSRPIEMVLDEGETAITYCPGHAKNLRIICLNNILYNEEKQESGSRVDNYDLGCPNEFAYKLYESKLMPRCEKYWSFALGIKEDISIAKAAICYDVENGSLKSLNYLSSSFNDMNLYERNASLSTAVLRRLVTDLNQFLAKRGTYSDKELVLKKLFEFETLILDDLSSQLGSHSKAFKIPFWTDLYKGNWKRFLDAFKEHIEGTYIKYNIFSGVSGSLEAPQLFYPKPKTYKDIPRYIWTYLKPVNNDSYSEEMVVIADNSPYIQVGHIGLLCKNRCNKIEWLNNHSFGRLNLMPSEGLMYCCKPDEVHLKLDFFPPLENKDDNPPTEDPFNSELLSKTYLNYV